ncbi:MAG TPA: tRNA 2-thiouridine(34) synthase MnmA [Opitutaceae bacterium]|nr:tRNA 2-thiouridine(34) synthase MnmA [Opitutaceae bacterium]
MPAREKILVAMSGGVDSSVAALLLKQQGHDVAGAYMKNWINEDGIPGQCPWEQDIADARAVAERLGINFQVVNLMRDYRESVVQYLLDGYARGLTPNPDVMCNREIKFGAFAAWARDHGFDAVATGHYARRVDCGLANADGGMMRPEPPAASISLSKSSLRTPQLWEGADKNKDQSYFLALLSPVQLAAARFPIGHLAKPELRRLAREAGLPNADKKDSQGICFIGQVKIQDFLRAYVPDHPGPIVRAADGRVLGEHRGLHLYTLGQRRGIGIPSNADFKNYVVVGKRAADHALLVAFEEPAAPGLFSREVRVHGLSWLTEASVEPHPREGRVRYRDPRVPLEFFPEAGGTARVVFQEPQRALASGQILAFYEGERLLGGGVYV